MKIYKDANLTNRSVTSVVSEWDIEIKSNDTFLLFNVWSRGDLDALQMIKEVSEQCSVSFAKCFVKYPDFKADCGDI